ncbi:cation diffusion facilitator family transporter [Alkalibaculum sp. M08DMB]|uniref:Cation diffusion facilitator family transporter n=1 Tax=Alkalibaculum sporogenes TaxID=2655001 RepID=A0A6A7K4Y6_9FIRM|nr:cation diffusion facilitator family transporter [Alkalibaculum sporogenes]MPW24526.1 cation diffusion facilitator family transporter [Alkalibaculum sporogenes]
MDNRYKSISKVLIIIFIANIIIAILKIILGSITNSVSLTADGFHSMSDGFSNIIGLIGIKLASKPVDDNHPYGHKKFETLSTLVIAGMLLWISIKVASESLNRFINPATPEISTQYLLLLILAIGINIFITKYEYRKGVKLKSEILKSDAIHTKSDVYVSIGVLLTMIFIKLGFPPIIDVIVSLAISVIILHAAYEIFIDNCDVLVDKRAVDEDVIKNILHQYSQVEGVHKIRSRGRIDEVFIDMHILTDPNMSIKQSHDMVHSIEERLKVHLEKNVQLVVHLEPLL